LMFFVQLRIAPQNPKTPPIVSSNLFNRNHSLIDLRILSQFRLAKS